jgi:hypothetical protein
MLSIVFDLEGLAVKLGFAGVVGVVASGVIWYRSAPTSSLISLTVRLVLGLFVFPGALLLWLFFAAIGGDESFTDGVVHGGIIGAGIVGAIPVVLALRRWGKVVRASAPVGEDTSSHRLAGTLLTLGALATIVVGVVALSRYFGHAPRNLALPTVSGTPRVGQTLHATPGRWDARGADSLDFDYSWFRCRGQDCTEFNSTTPEDEYVLDTDDVGARISVTVIAHGDLNELADSKPTAVIRR